MCKEIESITSTASVQDIKSQFAAPLWCEQYLYSESLFQTELSFLRSEDLCP